MIIKVGDRWRCDHCRERGFARRGWAIITRVLARRGACVPYVARCEQCGHEQSGELDYGLLAGAFPFPRKGARS